MQFQHRKMSEIEGRLREYGDDSSRKGVPIPYTILQRETDHSGAESLYMTQTNGKLKVTFTMKFHTSGYTLSVDDVLREENQIWIHPKVHGPGPNEMTLQVITYHSITLEIPVEDDFQGNVHVMGMQTESCSM